MAGDDSYHYYRSLRRKRRRRFFIAIAAVLIIIGSLETAISMMVARKLRETVATRLDARLELGVLLYVPPYGAWVSSARLARGDETIFRISRARVRLVNLPWKNKPIVFASVGGVEPVLSLRPGEFTDLVKHPGNAAPARKFSDILQLESLRFSNGQVVWRNSSSSVAPAVWSNLQINVDTTRQSPSGYTFRLVSRALPMVDATATGSFDVDSLKLVLDSASININAEPQEANSPLPAVVQEMLSRFNASATLSIDGGGTIDLRDPSHAEAHGTVSVRDVMAQDAAAGVTVDHATASADFTKPADGALEAILHRIDLGGPGKRLRVEGGNIRIDPVVGIWSLTEVHGSLNFSRRPAGSPIVSKMDRYDPAGSGEFTAAASGPLRLNGANPWQAIDHEIVFYPRQASFRPKDFAGRIEGIGGGEVRLHAGVIVCQELYGTYGNDELRLHGARLPVAGLPKLATWQELSGDVVFHPPLTSYSPKLDRILDALHPSGPFILAGSYTVDHRTAGSKNVYDLIVSSDTGSLSPTRLEIPLQHVRGDATVSPTGVDLQNARADLLGGQISVSGKWRHDGEQHHAEGDLTLENVDLAQLEHGLKSADHHTGDGSASSPVDSMQPMKGKIFAQVSFNGSIAKDSALPIAAKYHGIHANGAMEIVDGDLFKLPVITDVLSALAPLKDAATVGDAAAIFDLADSQIQLHDAAISAPVLGLDGGGRIGLDGSLDLSIVAAPLADWRDKLEAMKIPIVSDVAGALAAGIQKLLNTATGNLLYQFHVMGNLHKPELTTIPAPILTNATAYVFEQMLAPQKDNRPLDWFNPEGK